MRNYMPMVVIQGQSQSWADRLRERDRIRRRRLRKQNPATNMRQGVRDEAKRKGVECDLSIEWFRHRLHVGVCEISGLPFNFDDPRGPARPSIDRKQAGGHYTEANCRMVLYSINLAMSNWGEDYIIGVFKKIIERRGG